jgi:hypothetical protein
MWQVSENIACLCQQNLKFGEQKGINLQFGLAVKFYVPDPPCNITISFSPALWHPFSFSIRFRGKLHLFKGGKF